MRDMLPELATAAACVIALAAINTAYAIRRRKARHARQREQAALEQQLTHAIRAETRRGMDLTLDGDITALGKDAVMRRFLDRHPELRPTAGQEGGTP